MGWGNITKYTSLKESSSDTRFRALYINSMNNFKVQYKYIENINLSERVRYQEKQITFKEMMMTIKVNRIKLL